LPANVTEASVQNLLKLGFKRDEVIDALKTNNGDENLAKIKLLAMSLSAPKK
jgi:hypothetical protein